MLALKLQRRRKKSRLYSFLYVPKEDKILNVLKLAQKSRIDIENGHWKI